MSPLFMKIVPGKKTKERWSQDNRKTPWQNFTEISPMSRTNYRRALIKI